MSTTKVKQSSTILNILIIAVGAIFLFRAIIFFLAPFIVFPDFINDIIAQITDVAALGSLGIVSLVLAFWCIVCGIGMFKEAEWAMGQALVVLSVTVATTIDSVITLVTNPASFDFTDVSTWINLIAFVVGVVGFIWLLITRRRYD